MKYRIIAVVLAVAALLYGIVAHQFEVTSSDVAAEETTEVNEHRDYLNADERKALEDGSFHENEFDYSKP